MRFLILLFAFSPLYCWSQSQDSSVTVHEDPRIGLIINKPIRPFTGKMRGFRVQIYSGYDRAEANQFKIDFLRRFPDKRAYLTYHKPQFRVRVGDFPNRHAASEFARLLPSNYIIMVVPDIVTISPSSTSPSD